MMRLARSTIAVVLVCAACDGRATSAPGGPVLQLSLISGDGQAAMVGSAVKILPAVRLTLNGEPVVGAAVTFATVPPFPSGPNPNNELIPYHGGNLVGPVGITDSNGTAHVGGWRLGDRLTVDSLQAQVAGSNAVLFTATVLPGPASQFLKWAGDAQSVPAASALTVLPAVRATDDYGNGVAGVDVFFSVTSGGGSISGTNAVTGVDGVATLGGWTLGGAAGPNTVTALMMGGGAPGVPFTFTETGLSP